MGSVMKKSMFGLLLAMMVFTCMGCSSNEKTIIGKWYRLDEVTNKYDRSQDFNFLEDGTMKIGGTEIGTYKFTDDTIIIHGNNGKTSNISYTLISEDSEPQKLEMESQNERMTFVNANQVD